MNSRRGGVSRSRAESDAQRRENARAVWRAQSRALGRSATRVAPQGADSTARPDGEDALAPQERDDGWREVAVGLSLRRAEEFSLVLQARDVEHMLRQTGRNTVIVSPAHEAVRAREELDAYVAENRRGLASLSPPPDTRSAIVPVGFFLGLLIPFHLLTLQVLPRQGWYPHIWRQQGRADAGLIWAGEWWRAATALTLHADAGHLLGNVAVGTIFGAVLCAELGLGAGLLLMLLAGILGNLVNAAVLGPDHLSIGFSTAVFGAAGCIAGLRAVAGPYSGLRGGFVPLAAGLGLTAMLGTGGENTDLGAHIFGFLVGVPLGVAAGRATNRMGMPGRALDAGLLVTALALPVLAWMLAFT